MEEIKRPVMTLKECVDTLRSIGVRTSEKTICDGIEDGVYPFGIIKRCGPRRRQTEIYRVKFEAWAEETFGVKVAGVSNAATVQETI